MNPPDPQDLLLTARDAVLRQLLPALPAHLHYEARMVASALLIASREAAQGAACADIERQAMAGWCKARPRSSKPAANSPSVFAWVPSTRPASPAPTCWRHCAPSTVHN